VWDRQYDTVPASWRPARRSITACPRPPRHACPHRVFAIAARDGAADLIDCGDGNDVALLDSVDVIVDATPANRAGSCERVVRAAPGDGDAQTEDRAG
jgi:hypothetical protein